jgi:hypothetical protein
VGGGEEPGLLSGGPKVDLSPSKGPPWASPSAVPCAPGLSIFISCLIAFHLLPTMGALGWDIFIGGVVFKLHRVG